mmetsp:Transcript_34171/g.82020  ORF Transcript_34171/g.82020 Transcript_34171/m.82020 type:complete len:286 (+) Transcript_34171:1974-2831(+)
MEGLQALALQGELQDFPGRERGEGCHHGNALHHLLHPSVHIGAQGIGSIEDVVLPEVTEEQLHLVDGCEPHHGRGSSRLVVDALHLIPQEASSPVLLLFAELVLLALLKVHQSRLVPGPAEVQLGEPHRQAPDQAPGVLQLVEVLEHGRPALGHDGARYAADDVGHGLPVLRVQQVLGHSDGPLPALHLRHVLGVEKHRAPGPLLQQDTDTGLVVGKEGLRDAHHIFGLELTTGLSDVVQLVPLTSVLRPVAAVDPHDARLERPVSVFVPGPRVLAGLGQQVPGL